MCFIFTAFKPCSSSKGLGGICGRFYVEVLMKMHLNPNLPIKGKDECFIFVGVKIWIFLFVFNLIFFSPQLVLFGL